MLRILFNDLLKLSLSEPLGSLGLLCIPLTDKAVVCVFLIRPRHFIFLVLNFVDELLKLFLQFQLHSRLLDTMLPSQLIKFLSYL